MKCGRDVGGPRISRASCLSWMVIVGTLLTSGLAWGREAKAPWIRVREAQGPFNPGDHGREEKAKSVSSSLFSDFDDLPVTVEDENPGDGGQWLYTTADINPDPTCPMTVNDWAGWRSSTHYPEPNEGVSDIFYLYLNTYNSSHMGFSTYGYLDIDGTNAIRGNSLRYRVTGGINSSGTYGLEVTAKQHYLGFLAEGVDPVAHGVRVGHPYLYFANTSPSHAPVSFPAARGANRLSIYYLAPASLTNGQGGWSNRPEPTVNIGPFNGDGGHWYHEICNQGGGWTHVLADGHPQHNNSWSGSDDYPYPSRSLRDMGVDYFNGWYRWYLSFKPYEGIADAPYDVRIDEIEFRHDPEPQNNETICSPAVTWLPDTRAFEIGFMDKYKDNQYSYSTYELRYAFEPITNATWDGATSARILPDARFAIDERSDGRFAKHWPYYQSVWAPFTLASTADLDRLTAGAVIHFAIKDISQVDGDGMQPVTDSGIGRWPIGGRDYASHGDTFDYAGDRPVLHLIKRIDFQIPKEPLPPRPSQPTSLDAIAISSSKVMLSWADNADNETSFIIERKTGDCSSETAWDEIVTKAADAATHVDTTLTSGTTYSYRIKAVNLFGDSAWSDCSSAITGRKGTPRAPRGLKAISTSEKTVRLSWIDSSANETSFELYRSTAPGGAWTLLRTLPADTRRCRDTTATGNSSTTVYSYQVTACNRAGCSPATHTAAVPFSPTGLDAVAEDGDVKLTWTDRAENETGYQIFRKKGACEGAGWTVYGSVAENAGSYVDTGVMSGITYSYRVRAWRGSPPPTSSGYSLWSNCATAARP